jgi:hypothetical protein
VTDILIAVSMITLLLRSRTGLKSTDALVFRLVRYTVESGAATAFVALAAIALSSILPKTNIRMPACFVLSETYTISFYAVSTICEWFLLGRNNLELMTLTLDIQFSYDARPAKICE